MKSLYIFLLLLCISNLLANPTPTKVDQLKAEIKKIETVEKKDLKKTYSLIIETIKHLESKFDVETTNNILGIYNKIYDFDDNYYSIEFIHPLLKSHPTEFFNSLNKIFSKEKIAKFKVNIEIYERELKFGNDPIPEKKN